VRPVRVLILHVEVLVVISLWVPGSHGKTCWPFELWPVAGLCAFVFK
jgi:hypothetical protein